MLIVSQHLVVGLLFGNDNVYLHYSVPLQASLLGGFAFAWAACAIAPSGKRIAGTVLVTLLGVFVMFGVVAACTGQTETPVASSIEYIACLGSAIAGLATYRDERLHGLMTAVNRWLDSTTEPATGSLAERE
jgi:hypothetical protein